MKNENQVKLSNNLSGVERFSSFGYANVINSKNEKKKNEKRALSLVTFYFESNKVRVVVFCVT